MLVVTRLRNMPAALERLVGLLRRKAFALGRLSMSEAGDGTLEVCLRVGEGRAGSDRVLAEIRNLVDVLEVRDIAPDRERGMRAMVLARVDADGAAVAAGWRRVSHGGRGLVVEFTGAPAEVEAALASLEASGVLRAMIRSGELMVPEIFQPIPAGNDA